MSEFWYCLKHHRVEPTEGEPNKDRLGPYATEAEAARALEMVAERNEDWDSDGDDRGDDRGDDTAEA